MEHNRISIHPVNLHEKELDYHEIVWLDRLRERQRVLTVKRTVQVEVSATIAYHGRIRVISPPKLRYGKGTWCSRHSLNLRVPELPGFKLIYNNST